MIESFQQEKSIQEAEPQPFSFATVAEVYEDGLLLLFPGEATPAEKHYRCNTSCKFQAGQRVYVQKDGGVYVALFPVGAPATGIDADTLGGKAEAELSVATAAAVETAARATVGLAVRDTGNGAGTIYFRILGVQLQYRQGANGTWRAVQNA